MSKLVLVLVASFMRLKAVVWFGKLNLADLPFQNPVSLFLCLGYPRRLTQIGVLEL